MITIHVADSSVGNFSWEPPISIQAIILEMPEAVRAELIKEVEMQIKRFLLSISSTVRTNNGALMVTIFNVIDRNLTRTLQEMIAIYYSTEV